MTKSTLQITYIGHATAWIRLGDQGFLTDPNFSHKILTFHQRAQEPGIKPEKLPTPSALLVSRPEYDHLDLFSFKFFKGTTPLIVAKGLGRYVKKFLPNPVTEIPPGGQHRHGDTMIHGLKVPKRGWRIFPGHCQGSTAYLLASPAGTVLFCGDTRYGPQFKEIGQKFRVQVALLPVGKSLPPEQALQVVSDLGADHFIPLRRGPFEMTAKQMEKSLLALEEAAKGQNLESKLHLLRAGESWQLGPAPLLTDPAKLVSVPAKP